MKKYKILEILNKYNLKNSDLWIAEAKFGFNQLQKTIKKLKDNANILEVGCGSGILLAMLAQEFPKYKFSGLEPYSDGFDTLRKLSSITKKMGIKIKKESYEEHKSIKKYDFIYCINVFEHVNDWRNFLVWASKKLNNGGFFVVLCPNYGFPYESHFKIPIILNKEFTYKLFKKYINNFERNNDCNGLWNSLNFVKKSKIKKFCNQNISLKDLSLYDDLNIIDEMILRITKDIEFKKRQNIIGYISILIKKLKILQIIKIFPNVLPYMRLNFRKINNS